MMIKLYKVAVVLGNGKSEKITKRQVV